MELSPIRMSDTPLLGVSEIEGKRRQGAEFSLPYDFLTFSAALAQEEKIWKAGYFLQQSIRQTAAGTAALPLGFQQAERGGLWPTSPILQFYWQSGNRNAPIRVCQDAEDVVT